MEIHSAAETRAVGGKNPSCHRLCSSTPSGAEHRLQRWSGRPTRSKVRAVWTASFGTARPEPNRTDKPNLDLSSFISSTNIPLRATSRSRRLQAFFGHQERHGHYELGTIRCRCRNFCRNQSAQQPEVDQRCAEAPTRLSRGARPLCFLCSPRFQA